MAYTKTTWVNGSTPALEAGNLNKIEQGIQDAHTIAEGAAAAGYPAIRVAFSTLAGATDDAKLDTFMNTYRTATFKPTLELDELRAYTFTTQHLVFDGFAMIGGGYRAVDNARSQNVLGQVVRVRQPSGPRGMFTLPNGTVWGMFLGGLSFDSTASGRLFEPNPNCVIWTSTFRDISWQNGPSIMGSDTVLQPITACTFDGWWNINNVQAACFNIGGSDSRITPSNMLIDSPTNLLAPTGILLRLSSLSKTTVQNIYMTAEQHMGIEYTGGGTGSNEWSRILNCEIEGRNAGAPCYGALVRINYDLHMSSCWTSYAMSNPSLANGGASGNQGVIHITGRNVVIDGNTYRPATGVAQSVPYVYISGGTLRIKNITGSTSTGGTFTPVVLAATGVPVDADSSVTVTRF